MLLWLLSSGCAVHSYKAQTRIPAWMAGSFTDDYGIGYTITDSTFVQASISTYHILEVNEKEQYILVQNDQHNPSDKNLFTRIDYMQFSGMEPYTWGFCLTVFNAPDSLSARNALPADRSTPMNGCNGFPFSRMKKSTESSP